MSFTVVIEARAERQLQKLPRPILARIDKKICSLGVDPRPRGAVKLEGVAGDVWRVRVGDHRILYAIDRATRTVAVLAILPRPKAYR